MKRARALAAPSARDALFVKADGSGVEWKPLHAATWSADATAARAADLAARSVRATARVTDDGKYAKYVGSGSFVLASASEGIAISNGGAAAGSQGAAGHSPPGAAGLSARGAQGSGDAVGARGPSRRSKAPGTLPRSRTPHVCKTPPAWARCQSFRQRQTSLLCAARSLENLGRLYRCGQPHAPA